MSGLTLLPARAGSTGNRPIPGFDDQCHLPGDLFNLVLANKIKVEPSKTFALKDAAEAHRELESRKTTGSIILVP